MPVEINGKKYYRTSEAARMAGISRSTLLRWIEGGVFSGESHRDRRGWRLFTHSDVMRLHKEAGSLK